MIVDNKRLIQLLNNIFALDISQLNTSKTDQTKFAKFFKALKLSADKVYSLMALDYGDPHNMSVQIVATSITDDINNIRNLLTKIYEANQGNNSENMVLIYRIINEKYYNVEISETQKCSDCNVNLVYSKKYFICPKCKSLKYNNIDDFNIDNATQEVRSKNDNIVKHLAKNLTHIYGDSYPDKLPDVVSKIICDNIRKEVPNLKERVHFAYEVHEVLNQMSPIKCCIDGKEKIYYPRDYKIHANSFIKLTFPDIVIEKLKEDDYTLLFNTFLDITAEHQNLIIKESKGKPGPRYNIHYLYTIHRILFMRIRKPYIRNLLRFIYIQKPGSFANKDKKLFKINQSLRCFQTFYYTPEDIYINIERYL